MIDFIPYFGALITLMFSAGFAYAVGGGFDKDKKKDKM
ncbi:MAG: putative PurR-regulated permease PerM [Algoriphagus sp.]|jgi:predicted PurR-regulated permease PerM